MIVSATITGSRENEIAGALESVLGQVDRMVLVDTGVTDRTLERAKAVAKDLTVVKHPWKNDFSDARNASLDAARAVPGAEWILVLDTDERFDFKGKNLREELAHVRSDVVLIEATDGHYPKEKLVRVSAAAHFEGPTHEALVGGTKETLRGVTFSELGKSAADYRAKFERDAAILSGYVLENDDGRWWFYLAQSLEGLGKRAAAAEAYGKCVERRGGRGDEAAWSAYKQAEQLSALGRHVEAIAAAARGLGADPTYAECAWIASVSAARIGRAAEATAWARMAEAVGRFKGCGAERSWFRHLPALYELPYDVLRYTLPDETQRAQAAKDFHSAKLARVGGPGCKTDLDLDRLSITRSAAVHTRSEAREMLRPPALAATCPSARTTRIGFEPPAGWHPMNPGLTRHKGELWCVVRTVNYTMNGRKYDIPGGTVRTENYLGRLRPDGSLSEPHLVRDLDDSPRQPSSILGYEDMRLVSVKKKGKGKDGKNAATLVASATVCDRDPTRRMIARLELTPEGDVQKAALQASRQWHEKNWMPFAAPSAGGSEGVVAWIYSLDPTAIVPSSRSRPCPFALEHLRGGAATEYGGHGGYLAVAHEVIEANETRVYLHRFVRLSKALEVVAVSPAWVFSHHGIEFCAGMAKDGEELVLTYGVEDREAWALRVRTREIDEMEWHTP